MRARWPAVMALCCLAFLWCEQLAAQQTPATQDGVFTFKSKVNVVLVPVIVRDRKGHAVSDLKKDDFQIFDDGKPQIISSFTIQKRAEIASGANAAQPAPAIPSVTTPPTVATRFVVFLFDDLHLSFSDLAQAQKAGTKMMAASLASTDMAAVVSISGQANSGLTFDRAKLQEAIVKLHPQNLYRATGTDCPNIDYYQADQIENKHSDVALTAATEEVLSCSPGMLPEAAQRLAEGAARQVLAIGDQDVQVTLGSLQRLVRRMAPLPGQRTLILVSPGFLALTPQAIGWESQIMDMAAQSNVTINALDARGLYTTELDASVRGGSSPRAMQLKADYHHASMSRNEDVMAELAAGTGGSYFHNSNDIEGGLKRLAAAPECLYLLEFSIGNVKQNGHYHHLKVNVDHDGMKVQARSGYFVTKPAKNKK